LPPAPIPHLPPLPHDADVTPPRPSSVPARDSCSPAWVPFDRCRISCRPVIFSLIRPRLPLRRQISFDPHRTRVKPLLSTGPMSIHAQLPFGCHLISRRPVDHDLIHPWSPLHHLNPLLLRLCSVGVDLPHRLCSSALLLDSRYSSARSTSGQPNWSSTVQVGQLLLFDDPTDTVHAGPTAIVQADPCTHHGDTATHRPRHHHRRVSCLCSCSVRLGRSPLHRLGYSRRLL
jgi:hypothetical protein